MSTQKFNAPAWIIGALFTLTLVFGGAAYGYQATALSQAERRLNDHAERIAKLEALTEIAVKILDRLSNERRVPQ